MIAIHEQGLVDEIDSCAEGKAVMMTDVGTPAPKERKGRGNRRWGVS